jgi:hypothetical protein
LTNDFSQASAQNGGNVQVSQILIEIDSEIARLQQARDLLAGGTAAKRGRPTAAAKAAKAPVKAETKRKLSPEGRRKIAEAMKRRWAERRKEAAAKPTKSAAKAK